MHAIWSVLDKQVLSVYVTVKEHLHFVSFNDKLDLTELCLCELDPFYFDKLDLLGGQYNYKKNVNLSNYKYNNHNNSINERWDLEVFNTFYEYVIYDYLFV